MRNPIRRATCCAACIFALSGAVIGCGGGADPGSAPSSSDQSSQQPSGGTYDPSNDPSTQQYWNDVCAGGATCDPSSGGTSPPYVDGGGLATPDD